MENLGDIRRRKGMTLGQLSGRTGIPTRILREYEAGLQPIPYDHLARLAKALYVRPDDIRRQSEVKEPPEPEPRGGPRQPPPMRARSAAQTAPARPSQINHLLGLGRHFKWTQEQLEEEIGKPLNELTQAEASEALRRLQAEAAAQKAQRRMAEPRYPPGVSRHRAHLPEAVDGFELAYLTRQQEENALLTFTLFNGQTFTGRIIGFGTYNITLREESTGDEITLQKLAIAYYRRATDATATGEEPSDADEASSTDGGSS